MGESDALPLEETTPTQSLSPYAASKRTDEIYAQMYTQAFGLEVVALRYFNVYGPRQRPDSMYAAAVPIFVRRLLDGKPVTIFGDGGQTRDLIKCRDVVRANLIASEHPDAPGQIFNVCTGQETRLLDLLEVLFDLFPDVPEPVFVEPRAGDIYRSVGSAGVHRANDWVSGRSDFGRRLKGDSCMDAGLTPRPRINIRNRYVLLGDLALIIVSVMGSLPCDWMQSSCRFIFLQL